jgi:hypothetical protein
MVAAKHQQVMFEKDKTRGLSAAPSGPDDAHPSWVA